MNVTSSPGTSGHDTWGLPGSPLILVKVSVSKCDGRFEDVFQPAPAHLGCSVLNHVGPSLRLIWS